MYNVYIEYTDARPNHLLASFDDKAYADVLANAANQFLGELRYFYITDYIEIDEDAKQDIDKENSNELSQKENDAIELSLFDATEARAINNLR